MRVKMRGVNKVTARLASGNVATYYYHRATGKRLEGEPGSDEFLASYTEANKAPIRIQSKENLSGLIAEFKDADLNDDWRTLADSTKAEYNRMFKAIEAEYGPADYAAIQAKGFRSDVIDWQHKLAAKSPREADNRVTLLARVLSWAEGRGRIDRNILTNLKRLYDVDRSDLIWLPEHVTAFCAVAPQALQQALMLALHTGQRQGDLIRLTWNSYDGEAITLKQSKSKRGRKPARTVYIPCTQALKEMLDAMKKSRKQAVILTTATGVPWKGKNLQHRWQLYSGKAGIDDLHFNDLRGTAVTMLAEAGCTNAEIASITGHSLKTVDKILERYLARTKALARNAIAKLENASRTNLQNGLAK